MSLIDLEIGVKKLQGDRKSQMDRFDVDHHCFDSKNHSLFIIYDGHGDGSFSKHAEKNLADLIMNDDEFKKGNYGKAFFNGFQQEDHLLKEKYPRKIGGTTATAALFFKNVNSCYVANVGDSTAVLGSRSGRKPEAIPVSIDDKPDVIIERNRLADANAKVRKGRLIRPSHSINMTRALGDFDFKAPCTPSGQDWISPIPHVHKIDLIPYCDEFLVLASDGLWNVYDEETVVESISRGFDKGYNVHQISAALASSAVKHCQSSDNVTVMLIFFIWGRTDNTDNENTENTDENTENTDENTENTDNTENIKNTENLENTDNTNKTI